MSLMPMNRIQDFQIKLLNRVQKIEMNHVYSKKFRKYFIIKGKELKKILKVKKWMFYSQVKNKSIIGHL